MQVARVASLTLVNAMIFQQILSDNDPRVQKLSRTTDGVDVGRNFANVWEFILEKIDYVPIFTIARRILMDIQGSPGTDEALKRLAQTAENITKRRAALRHDLMGRIYHRLLADAKYFGAFYTTVPAAALLLKLTLDPNVYSIDWSDLKQVEKLRIGDLACGTGTLLKAALQTVVDNYIRACAEKGERPDITQLHRTMVENCLYGLDVVEFAIHLSASALAVHEPDIQFREMRLWTMPLGKTRAHSVKLGSIELFAGHQALVQADLFGGVSGPERMTGFGTTTEKVRIPNLDVCVMNPPFVRSVGGNLLFGNLPAKQRRRMQDELKKLIKNDQIPANVTAGLGSVFAALGNRYVKPNGHLSLVLPRALLSGVAWKRTRKLLGELFQLEYVIVSHELGGWNFSENTKLSECMVVCRRLNHESGEKSKATKFVNLWKKPTSSIEAMTYAQEIKNTIGVDLNSQTGTSPIVIGTRKVGEVILAPPTRIIRGNWAVEASFSQTDLCRTAFFLSKSQLYVPGRGVIAKLPMTPLARLGRLGPDARDIHDAFDVVAGKTAYAAFWSHDTNVVMSMEQKPNAYLSPLANARPKRPLRDPHLMWSRSGRVLIAERLRLNTARMFAIRLNKPVLTNSWWTVRPFSSPEVTEEDVETVLTLWLNSTLGIFSIIASRVDTEGAWIKFKKPIWKEVAVLDPFALTRTQCTKLTKEYEALKVESLSRLPEIANDAIRAQIDKALMKALGVDVDLSILRELIAQEPVLTPI